MAAFPFADDLQIGGGVLEWNRFKLIHLMYLLLGTIIVPRFTLKKRSKNAHSILTTFSMGTFKYLHMPAIVESWTDSPFLNLAAVGFDITFALTKSISFPFFSSNVAKSGSYDIKI